jgi:capsular exopolysaccharide synthesis family protein
MGRITDALKKAAEDRLTRLDKLDRRDEVKYHFVAHKTVESNIDPRIVSFYDPASPVSEQYRSLRTHVLALDPKKTMKTFAITSSIHSEGKSISSVNFAITMARELNKKRIALIDADLRRGSVHKYLGIKNTGGLAGILNNTTENDDSFVAINGIENLDILPCGKYPENPAELVGSIKFRNFLAFLKGRYDYVIFDTPPIIPVTDAGVIGAQLDGVIMTVQAGRTQRGIVKHAGSLLRQANAKLLGYVITNVQYHIPAYIYRYL